MNLYRVKINMADDLYGTSYVVAENPSDAYKAVRDLLDYEDIGMSEQRSMKSVELLAEAKDYPECGTRLYLP